MRGVSQITFLHPGDELLVEHALRLLVQRAVDRDDITLGQHFLERVDPSTSYFLLGLAFKGLVVEVEELLAVERLEAPQNTLADAADADGTDDFVLNVPAVLGDGGHVPVPAFDLLVRRHKISDEDESGHDDMFCDADNVA